MTTRQIKVAPSILSANFAHLEHEVTRVTKAGADLIHVDVMDGHFVPNITIGQCVVQALKKISSIPLDVHLMISEPEKFLSSFVDAGSDWITFHVEAVQAPLRLIEQAKNLGVKVGISLRPATKIDAIYEFLPDIDLVLVMSVEPGFGGQKFLPNALNKVRELRNHRHCPLHISIDGGINLETASQAIKAGVDILVSGTAVFGADDPAEMIQLLKSPR